MLWHQASTWKYSPLVCGLEGIRKDLMGQDVLLGMRSPNKSFFGMNFLNHDMNLGIIALRAFACSRHCINLVILSISKHKKILTRASRTR